ncbi:MAG: sigma 54-interacting transcriptional regulator [Archangium sp.]
MEERTDTLDSSLLSHAPLPARLLVLSGPDAGKSLDVRDGTTLIGSHPDCSLQLTDAGVSRRHLSIELVGTRARARDLGSKNGTRYLGAKFTTLDIPLGASIDLGSTTLAVLPMLRPGVLSERQKLGEVIGRSTAMRRLFTQLEQLAPTDATCLLRGETGTGKELIARTLHSLSPRAGKAFVALDCAALTPSLIQSVLFGHIKGAFTGAVRDSEGLVASADGGTLFLDEVGALPLELQPVLLRVLETRAFQRVGENKVRSVDFRVLAATTSELPQLVKAGKFRSDLYFRLASIVLEVPPLRERLDDVPLLAQHFAHEAKAAVPLTPAAVSALSAWRWPGNVRELRNAVERAVTLGEAPVAASAAPAGAPDDFHAARDKALAAFERSYLEALLTKHRGSASAVARDAGIARSYLYRLLETHGLEPEKFRS